MYILPCGGVHFQLVSDKAWGGVRVYGLGAVGSTVWAFSVEPGFPWSGSSPSRVKHSTERATLLCPSLPYLSSGLPPYQ